MDEATPMWDAAWAKVSDDASPRLWSIMYSCVEEVDSAKDWKLSDVGCVGAKRSASYRRVSTLPHQGTIQEPTLASIIRLR